MDDGWTDPDGGPRVLVVDDERELADLYAIWLGEAFDVTVAYGGESALETIVTQQVDVVFLDRHMPDLSGDLVVVSLRDRGLDVPVVMVTGVSPDVDIIRLGFDEYLTKPVDRETLLETAHEMLELESYETVTKQLSALRVKRNVLQMEVPDRKLDADERYHELLSEIERLERMETVFHGGPREAEAD